MEQYALIKNCRNVISIKVNTEQHGIAMNPYGVRRFISYNLEQCKQLAGEIHDKRKLSVKVGGVMNLARYYVRKLMEKVLRR